MNQQETAFSGRPCARRAGAANRGEHDLDSRRKYDKIYRNGKFQGTALVSRLICFQCSTDNAQMNNLLSVGSITMIIVLTACSPAASSAVATSTSLPPLPTASAPAPAPTQTAAPIVSLTFPAIAFYGNRTGDNEIYVMNEDGSGQVDLTNNPANDTHPVWSPDHTRIAFSSDRDGNWEIYVMNADGSGLLNLTQNPALDDYPSWSPDGKQIAFDSNRSSGNQYHYDLFFMNADGSEQTKLTSEGKDILVDGTIAWSPDGTRIAVLENYGGEHAIILMNPDGSGAVRIPFIASSVAWSPDGKRLAVGFGSDSDERDYEVYVMNADGSDQTDLTNNPAKDDHPVWSPDGKQIAFNSDRDGNQDVYVMNADGSNPTNLTNSPGFDYSPAWSMK